MQLLVKFRGLNGNWWYRHLRFQRIYVYLGVIHINRCMRTNILFGKSRLEQSSAVVGEDRNANGKAFCRLNHYHTSNMGINSFVEWTIGIAKIGLSGGAATTPRVFVPKHRKHSPRSEEFRRPKSISLAWQLHLAWGP